MVVAVSISPPVKGRVPKLSMLELVSVANSRYKISKLRKRILPKGFCYVCSRIDPSGIFRQPNSHLYKKGFFHSCEHFPKAPYTTFVQDEAVIQDNDGGDSLTEFATNQTETISVTIRKGSQSTKFPSPFKREGTFDSYVSQFDAGQKSPSQDHGTKSRVSEYIAGRLSLPSISKDNPRRTHSSSKGVGKLDVFKTPSGAQTRLSKQSILESETLPAGSETGTRSLTDRVTIIPTAIEDHTSAITELSTFTSGTTPSKSTNDLDSKFESEKGSLLKSIASKYSHSSRTTGTVSEAVSKGSHSHRQEFTQKGPIINQSDGLDDIYTVEPLVREAVMLESSPDYPIRRPKAGHYRDRMLPRRRNDSSDESVSTQRPESGHLRYHHRGEIDSVPHPGFEIPPTPSEDISEIERNKLEHGTNKVSTSSKITDSSSSDNASTTVSEKTNRSTSKLSRIPSETRSFCRCNSSMREISFSRNICKTCGKACHASCGDVDTSQTITGTDRDITVSNSKKSMSTRQNMLQRDDLRMNLRSKQFTDEDYMDLDSIIHEDDGRYWSSDEDEFGALGQSPVSWYRYKHAQPYPLVDPDIHKIVYIKALQAAQLKGKKKPDDFVFDELERLRRPNVFSYIPLLPRVDKNNPEPKNIGIRPDDSEKPKRGQYMKHIFGDIKLEDFYPGGRYGKTGKVVIDESSKFSSTDQTSSERASDEDETVQKSKEPERSSISLKMRKQGISFENDV